VKNTAASATQLANYILFRLLTNNSSSSQLREFKQKLLNKLA